MGGGAEIIIRIVIIVGSVIIVWISVSVPIITSAIHKLHIGANAYVEVAATVFPLDDSECATESSAAFLATLIGVETNRD